MAANLHFEEPDLATALREAGGVKLKAAEILGTTPGTISHYMKKFPRLHKVVERAKAERRESAERNRKEKERRWGAGMSGLLNPRQRRFVEEYLVGLNAKQSAIKAGYGGTPESAAQYAVELMKKPHVKAAIQEGMRERSIRTGIDQDMVVNALSRVAFSNIKDFVDWVALSVPADFIDSDRGGIIIIKPIDEIDGDRLAAIKELAPSGGRFKLRMHDKLKALELLGKHLGMFGPKPPEVSMGIDMDAENIRARMLDRLKQAQQASENISEDPPSGAEASEASF